MPLILKLLLTLSIGTDVDDERNNTQSNSNNGENQREKLHVNSTIRYLCYHWRKFFQRQAIKSLKQYQAISSSISSSGMP